MLESVLPNPSRSQLCEFLLPIKVISYTASQDDPTPDLTFRGFNILQAALQLALLMETVLTKVLDCFIVCLFFKPKPITKDD